MRALLSRFCGLSGSSFHFIGDADQLPIEQGNSSSRETGDYREDGDYYSRCVAALFLFFGGCATLLWGLRIRRRADWRYLLLALLVSESGGFIWPRTW
jgi:hypothetical protein